MANHGTETNQFMSNLPLTSSHPHPTVGNPGDDQSMSDLHLTSSHTHSTLGDPGDQFIDFDESDWMSVLNDSGDSGVKDADVLPSPSEIRMEGIPSPGLAADAAAVAEIGQPASGLLGEHSRLTSAAVANKLPPARMELSDGVCRDQSLFDISTSTARAMHHAGALDDNSIRGPHPARGHFQPDMGTVDVRNPCPFSEMLEVTRLLEDLLKEKPSQEEADFIRDISEFRKFNYTIAPKDYLVQPWVHPTRNRRYITRFVAKLDDDKKAGYWKEKEAKAIRDPSASRNIIGMKRTLEFMNGGKRTHWLADEYVALEPWGHDALHILDDIAVRRVYEEGKETAPPSKCSKTGAHSSGESYIWQHMTRVYAGSTEAPSLLYGICHECDKALKCPPNFGNGNLNKHLARVHDIHPPCKNQCVMTGEKGVGRRAVRV
ncbi:uncharacterized protein LOC112899020 isoform X3 [Panicum hallii]|uniref:uncharacterized protein LOC112899020 isoform X2 n=1 Tax=Panicum hallii TaxID=206008 RepID=UPI000DF4D03E|nr:uncharacterized protein LOC112899020 isoform X2 [Panicum hallii]XP_025823137.1 uncharacterized protein LOC112899020 isoform X3 [Panicum hallii]